MGRSNYCDDRTKSETLDEWPSKRNRHLPGAPPPLKLKMVRNTASLKNLTPCWVPCFATPSKSQTAHAASIDSHVEYKLFPNSDFHLELQWATRFLSNFRDMG